MEIVVKIQIDEETRSHFIDALKSISFYENFTKKEAENDEEEFYTSEEARKLLKLKSVSTLNKYCRTGIIKATKSDKNWIIPKKSLKNYINQNNL